MDYSEEKIGTPHINEPGAPIVLECEAGLADRQAPSSLRSWPRRAAEPSQSMCTTSPALNDGNLTISRSPIKDPEMVNYFKYLLTTGQSGIALQGGNIVDGNGVVLVERLSTLQVTIDGREHFINALGHRWAKLVEVSRARSSHPGHNQPVGANRQVKPRNLPGQVNEYGFDVGSYHGHGSRAWWVVKNSTLPIPDFNATVFDNNGSENENFGQRVAVHGNLVAVCRAGSNNQDLKRVYIYEVDGMVHFPSSTSSLHLMQIQQVQVGLEMLLILKMDYCW